MNSLKRLAYQPYKWLVFLPLFFILSLIVFPSIILAGLIAGGTNSVSNKYIPFIWSYLTLRLIGCKVTVTGRENIDKNKSYVFVMNHTSNLDSPNSTMVFMKITWVMKESLGKIPVFGAALRTCGSVFVNRSDPASARQAVIDSSERIKRDGLSVVFFPEGTRTLDGKLQPFKKGAFKMAEDLDLDVVPVVIKGAYEVLTPGKFNLYPGEIKIHIHKPLEVSLGADKLLEESYRIIESDLNG